MDTFELLHRLAVALAIGLLIGLERGWQQRNEADGQRTAGLRTLALTGLLGGVCGALWRAMGDAAGLLIAAVFLALSAALTLFRYREAVSEGKIGVTTIVAAMLSFVLGLLAVVGNMQAAGATAVAATVLLALKSSLHNWLSRISWTELRAGLLLLAMSFIALPALPNQTVDPWGTINPYEIWLMTVLIAVISFVGYIAVKVAGAERGVLMTGVAGGLASSTAVTLSLARLAHEHPAQTPVLLAGTLVAGATMVVRVLVVAGVIAPALLTRLGVPLGLAALVLAGAGLLYLWRAPRDEGGQNPALLLKNPFELSTVLKFGALLAIIVVAAKAATGVAGNWGAYAVAALSGIGDVDAITLSMARLSSGPLGAETATRAIALAVTVNTFAKAALGWTSGGAKFGRPLVAVAIVAVIAGAAGHMLATRMAPGL